MNHTISTDGQTSLLMAQASENQSCSISNGFAFSLLPVEVSALQWCFQPMQSLPPHAVLSLQGLQAVHEAHGQGITTWPERHSSRGSHRL